MDRPNTPSRPPEYTLPSYDDERDTPTGSSGNAAAVRLLTSMDEPLPDPRLYVVSPLLPALAPPPLCISKLPVPLATCEVTGPPQQSPSPPAHRVKFASPPAADEPPRRKGVAPKRSPTVKLQKKKKPAFVVQSVITEALPVIPEGPSARRSSIRQKKPSSEPSTPAPAYKARPTETRSLSNANSPRPSRRSYQPSVTSDHSRRQSFVEPPILAAPDSSYVPYRPRDEPSPTRSTHSWTPSRMSSDFSRPPPGAQYEPADLNGEPRPGTPSSRYGGSPRRPLPPAPLFSNPAANRSFADDATVCIPLGPEGDDVFGPTSDISDSRPGRESYLSGSQVTLSEQDADDAHYEKVEHYGPAPEGRQERRGVREPQMAKKAVQLINGELVLECKIPTILYSFLPRRDEIEFTHMRYTAVTCDPDDFVGRGYKLRQNIGRTARETELFICVTMYNEDEYGFTRTMYAVMKNISHFCARNKSRTWGEHGWQKIVVCVVSDGREKIHPRTLDALAAMGVYQHGIAKNYVNQKAVQAHVYEYTTQVSLDSDLKFKGAEKGIVPCQMILCLKEKNQKKLNSHRWFFNAFGKALNPNVCILLDVGTRPGTKALYHLWKAFDNDSNVAGACGEIKAMKGKSNTPF